MLVIGLLRSIQLAMVNYHTRKQLQRLSAIGLKDVGLSVQQARTESEKGCIWFFLKEVVCNIVSNTRMKGK